MPLISDSMVAVRKPSMKDTARKNSHPKNGRLPGLGANAAEVACVCLLYEKRAKH